MYNSLMWAKGMNFYVDEVFGLDKHNATQIYLDKDKYNHFFSRYNITTFLNECKPITIVFLLLFYLLLLYDITEPL